MQQEAHLSVPQLHHTNTHTHKAEIQVICFERFAD